MQKSDALGADRVFLLYKRAHIDRVASLILMAMTVEHNVHAIVVQHILHCQSHALILLVMIHICSRLSQSQTEHDSS